MYTCTWHPPVSQPAFLANSWVTFCPQPLHALNKNRKVSAGREQIPAFENLQSNQDNCEHQKYVWNVVVLHENNQAGVRKPDYDTIISLWFCGQFTSPVDGMVCLWMMFSIVIVDITISYYPLTYVQSWSCS